MRRPFTLILIGLTLLLLTPCPSYAGISVSVGKRQALPSNMKQVVIYYANETSPEGEALNNYTALLSWLKNSKSAAGPLLANHLELDRDQFPRVVDTEIAALADLTERSQMWRQTGLLIATNRLVRSGKLLLHMPGQGTLSTHAFAPPPTNNYILATSPLVQTETLRLVLAKAAELFPPHRHAYVLVLKSHASPNLAATAAVSVRHETIKRSELDAALFASEENTGSRENPAVPSLLPSWTDEIGISKDTFLATIDELGRTHRMSFLTIFVESISNGTAFPASLKVPSNVGRLYTTDQFGIVYGNLDYQNMSHASSPVQGLGQALAQQERESLEQTGIEVRLPRAQAFKTWYILPLLVTGSALFLWRRYALR